MNNSTALLAACMLSCCVALTQDEIDAMKCKPGVIEATSGLTCQLSVTALDEKVEIFSNGIPDHQVQPEDWGNNPNRIQLNNVTYTLPMNPTKSAIKSCLPMGTIGLLKNGVSLFNPFDVNGRDASIYEDLDQCGGHPQENGIYHYHYKFNCMNELDESDGNEVFLGVAMDGFPIYSKRDKDGNVIQETQLDECRGMTVDGRYRYVIGDTFPYALGCLSGSSCVESNFMERCAYDIDSNHINDRVGSVECNGGSGMAQQWLVTSIIAISACFMI